jgi:hypothetical protein
MSLDEATVTDDDPAFRHALIKRRIHSFCLWSWPICIVGFIVSFAGIAGFVPPPHEDWTAPQVAHFFAQNRDAIRVGMIGAMFFSALMVPFFTVLSHELRKIEGKGALLAPVQFGGAVILVTFFQIIGLFWLVATFRADADPQLVRFANDFCWMVWMILIPTYSLQFVCVAVAGFMDTRVKPALPRWSAYMNIWVAVTGAGGVASVWFKTGPFSWTGIVAFWIPVIAFAGGMTVNMILLRNRHNYETELALAVPTTAASPRDLPARSSGIAVGVNA